MVSKLGSYEQAAPSDEVMLVADRNDGFNFESASAALDGLMPANLRINHINRGAMNGETPERNCSRNIESRTEAGELHRPRKRGPVERGSC